MKRTLAWLLTGAILLFFAGCQQAPAEKIIPHTAAVCWANYTEDESFFRDALNAANADEGHLPIFRCDSRRKLEEFRAAYESSLTFSLAWDEVPAFDDIATAFTEAHFAENAVLLVYVTSGSCSYRFAADGVTIRGQKLTVQVRQTNNPEAVDNAMAGWLIAVSVKKDAIRACKTFDACMVG